MTIDIRDQITDLVQQAVEEAIADPEGAAERVEQLLPSGSVPPVAGWPAPSAHARRRAQGVVCHAVAVVQALERKARGDVVYTQLRELPEVEYAFKPCTQDHELALAPLLTYCLSDHAGLVLATLTGYRFAPVFIRNKGQDDEVDLFEGKVRRGLSRRLNAFALVESHLWFLAGLGDPNLVVPYAVRYDLARFLWDRQQAGHLLCLRCGDHHHYKHPEHADKPRTGRCRPCSRGKPDAWPAHALEPHTRGKWWLLCRAEACSRTYIARADKLRCPNCRLDKTTPSHRRPLVGST